MFDQYAKKEGQYDRYYLKDEFAHELTLIDLDSVLLSMRLYYPPLGRGVGGSLHLTNPVYPHDDMLAVDIKDLHCVIGFTYTGNSLCQSL
jgi:hypothetical protein